MFIILTGVAVLNKGELDWATDMFYHLQLITIGIAQWTFDYECLWKVLLCSITILSYLRKRKYTTAISSNQSMDHADGHMNIYIFPADAVVFIVRNIVYLYNPESVMAP